MTKRSSTYLKGISETGDIANQTLFEDLIDSMGVVDSGTTFDDSGTITVDSTVEYSTIRTVTGSTHTLTAATSGNVAGNYKKVRYTFDVDCTLTLTDFDETGSTLGTVNPIPAGTYDFWFFTTPFGLALLIQNNTGTTPGTLSTPTLVLTVGNGQAGYTITNIDPNATAGVLEYSTDNVNWTTWGSYSFGTETGTITGLTNGVLYYGRYRNSASGYNPSGYATDTVTPSAGVTQLTQPAGLYLVGLNQSITLHYDSIDANADSVSIQRSLSSGSGFSTIATISRALTTYEDTPLTNDVRYYYRIIANGSGSYSNSDPSAESSTYPRAVLLSLDGSDIDGLGDGNPANGTAISTWADKSGQGNDASQATGADQATVQTGALRFSDDADHYDISKYDEFNGNGGTELSVFVKINTTDTKTSSYVLSQWDFSNARRAWRLYLNNGKISFAWSDDGTNADPDHGVVYEHQTDLVNDGSDHIIGFVFNSGTIKGYIDGVEKTLTKIYGSGTVPATIYETLLSDILIGLAGFSQNIVGDIFKIRQYPKAITQTEITQLESEWA